jgi:glycosyltransferase involved in cell wall biosynthesis
MKRPLETLRLVASMGAPNLKLLVIGPDEDLTRAQLEAEARALRWNGLRLIGPVFGENKFEYLGLADAYVSLSYRENFNYTLAEAMAAGLPPILSPGNDLGWEFAGDGFSWQLKSDSVEEARRALVEFLNAPSDELTRRGAAAREWAGKNLSLGQLREQLNSLVPDQNEKANIARQRHLAR